MPLPALMFLAEFSGFLILIGYIWVRWLQNKRNIQKLKEEYRRKHGNP